MTATTHSCEGVLDVHYIPGHDEDNKELFQQKQYFIHSVFNKVLQRDMGKTIVRKHAPNLDAQSVWREFESHMSTSSKDSMKGIGYMPVCPQLFMIDPGRVVCSPFP